MTSMTANRNGEKSRISVAELADLRHYANRSIRPPLTTTHPHGRLIVRKDRRIGLVSISKNASTELTKRLRCTSWVPFDAHSGPAVVFFREPESRFISSIPETMLRITCPEIAIPGKYNPVCCPEDIYRELCAIAAMDIPEFLNRYLELVTYSFFDAHHEPQINFVVDRNFHLRINPHAYPFEDLEGSLSAIHARFGVASQTTDARRNVGGAKPLRQSTAWKDALRRLTHTGLYRTMTHPGPLAVRYGCADHFGKANRPMRRVSLNALANRFAAELKQASIPVDFGLRISRLYEGDVALWKKVGDIGGDVPLASLGPF